MRLCAGMHLSTPAKVQKVQMPIPLLTFFTTERLAYLLCAGALPFFFVRSLSPLMSGLATAVACGVMFACSFDLVHTGEAPLPAALMLLQCTGQAWVRYIKSGCASIGGKAPETLGSLTHPCHPFGWLVCPFVLPGKRAPGNGPAMLVCVCVSCASSLPLLEAPAALLATGQAFLRTGLHG